MGPSSTHHFFLLSGEFQMKPYAFKCNSAGLRVWPQEDVCPQGLGASPDIPLRSSKDMLHEKLFARIDVRCFSLFKKWRYSSQLCYVSLPGGSLNKVVCFLGLEQTPGFVYMFMSARGGCRYLQVPLLQAGRRSYWELYICKTDQNSTTYPQRYIGLQLALKASPWKPSKTIAWE